MVSFPWRAIGAAHEDVRMMDTLALALGLHPQAPEFWMPLAFMGLLFIVVLAGMVLDGFDIGVGCLSVFAPGHLKPRMLALLSPWRDANEFWLFLGLGLFMAAFPLAWARIMGELYLPVTLLAVGTLLRSVGYELRLRAPRELQAYWARLFGVGALLTALSHGLLLAQIAMLSQGETGHAWFAVFTAACAVAAYCLLGASWLIMREGGELRARAVFWGRRCVRWAAAGAVAVSVVLALGNPGIFLKWGGGAPRAAVAGVWFCMLAAFVGIEMCLQRMINTSYRNTALPFAMTLLVFCMTFSGLAYSFFPYLVLDELTIWDAAAATDSLELVLVAVAVALPIALVFNARVYWRMFGLSVPPEPPEFGR